MYIFYIYIIYKKYITSVTDTYSPTPVIDIFLPYIASRKFISTGDIWRGEGGVYLIKLLK